MHGFLPFSQVYRVFIIPYNVWKCCIFNEFWVPEWTLFNIPLETLLDDSAEAEPAAAQEKLPAEEQAKEEDKGQGKARRYKAIVLVIVLLAILLTTAVLAHRRTAQEKMGAMTFSEMECDDFDFAGAESVPMEGFGEGR